MALIFTACNRSPVPKYSAWESVSVNHSQIELNWSESYFIHESLRIDIPEKWSIAQNKSDYDDLDKHDLKYQYEKRTKTLEGDTEFEVRFADIDHEQPSSSAVNFEISTVGMDIDSKIIIQDELVNDRYFMYVNDAYNNECLFKISQNDILQLKSGSFNSIRLELKVLTHFDSTKSFYTRVEDGLPGVGEYKDVGIYFNPELE